MDLQLIEVHLTKEFYGKVDQALQEFSYVGYWTDHNEDNISIRMLIRVAHTEEILDYLEKFSTVAEGFQVMLFNVEAYVPAKDIEDSKEQDKQQQKEKEVERASRQELYSAINSSSQFTRNYLWLVILSTLVAIGGMVKNSTAIVIGAMVIAPLLGPVIAVSFSANLGDFPLIRKSLVTLLSGFLVALMLSIGFGLIFPLPTENLEFVTRTRADISDLILALASGAAGALSFVGQLEGALVGVMVAVALLPPTVVLGMTLGAALWQQAFGSLLLLLININALLISGIIVFWISGIKAVAWEDIQKANTNHRYSLLFIGGIVLLFLVAFIMVSS